jgi:hypothetical protein
VDLGGTSDPFVKIVFDNFQREQTSVKYKELNPKWENEAFAFKYSTRYADCLSRKSVVFEIYDHNTFSANALIGFTKVDLQTVATGPISHELQIRDGRKLRGKLFVDIVMEEIAGDAAEHIPFTEIKFDKIFVDGENSTAVAIMEKQKEVKFSLSAPLNQHFESQVSTGAIMVSAGWSKPPVIQLKGSISSILSSTIDFNILSYGAPLGSARMLLSDWRAFNNGEFIEFMLPISSTNVLRAAGLSGKEGTLFISGRVAYNNLPKFAQMLGGIHALDGSIKGGKFAYADIPFIPSVPCLDDTGKEINVRVLAKEFLTKRTQVVSSAKSSNKTVLPDSSVNPYIVDLYTPQYAPGVIDGRAAPAVVDRLFGGAPGLPVCWIRRTDEHRVGFENIYVGRVETTLPSENEYIITLPATATGGLGLLLEPNFSGTERFGVKSGRRNSGFDQGAVVRSVKPDGIIAQFDKVRPGHHLISINGTSLNRSSFKETTELLKAAGRPLLLRFHDPYAVSANLAALAVKGNVNEAQAKSIISSSKGTAKVAVDEKMKMEAQATLDLAIQMLSTLDVSKANKDPELKAALSDAAFLRTMAAAVSGNAMDAAPENVRDKLEEETAARALEKKREADKADLASLSKEEQERQIALMNEEHESVDLTDIGTSDESPVITSEATALHAIDAIKHIAEGGNIETNRSINEGMTRAEVFKRTLMTVQRRNTPEFTEKAVTSVVSVANTKKIKPTDLGLDGESLITIQSAGRRVEFGVTAIDAIKNVSSLLADDHSEQDGEGYIRLLAECISEVHAFSAAGYMRHHAKDGSTFYVVPGGASEWHCPTAMKPTLKKLVTLDRYTRQLEDIAVPDGTKVTSTVGGKIKPSLVALGEAIMLQLEDTFITSVLMGCAAKLAYLPRNAKLLMNEGGIFKILNDALATHTTDLRVCECVAAIFFNCGRELDQSVVLLENGCVPKITALARAYINARMPWTGTPCSWPPEGEEDMVEEYLVLPAVNKLAKDKNVHRPRLVRMCVNVLINLACYRRKISSGQTAVSLIVANKGVELLGQILLSHINDVTVVTGVLNCAANMAFKNREVQLAIGLTMTDAITLSALSFQRDNMLLSMALRAIGNLTNEDVNIFRGLGFGVIRVISIGMKANSSDVALLTLAASVLSNLASIEGTDDPELVLEDLEYFKDAHALRVKHPMEALRPTSTDAATVSSLLRMNTEMWKIGSWLMLEEGAVAGLISAMQRFSTDKNLVDACLRTLLCVVQSEDVDIPKALVSRNELIGKTILVMRASDFEVEIQLSGAMIFEQFVKNRDTIQSVAASDASLTMLASIENHKSLLINALQGATTSILSAVDQGNLSAVIADIITTKTLHFGKVPTTLTLIELVCSIVTVLTLNSTRALKAAIEVLTPASLMAILQAALGLLNAATRRGINMLEIPQVLEKSIKELAGLCESVSGLLYILVRHPGSNAAALVGADGKVAVSADEEACCLAARNIVTGGGRNFSSISRLCELCIIGTGEPESPAKMTVPLRVAKAITSIAASFLIRSPVLPTVIVSDRNTYGPMRLETVEVDTFALSALASSNFCNSFGAILLSSCQALLSITIEQVRQFNEQGLVKFDAQSTISRHLVAQSLLILDIVGSCCETMDVSVLATDFIDAASAALNNDIKSGENGAFIANDVAVSPLKLSDLADVGHRISTKLNIRVSDATKPPEPSTIGPSEARSIFTFSMAKAKQGHISSSTIAAQPTTPQRATTVQQPVQPKAPIAAQPNSAAPPVSSTAASAPPPPSGIKRTGSEKSKLQRAKSMKGFAGPIVRPTGVAVTLWIGDQSPKVILRADETTGDLIFFPAALLVKPGVSALTIANKGAALAVIEHGGFDIVRVGVEMKAGKAVAPKSGGFLGLGGPAGPAPAKTICLDSVEGDTIARLECANAKEATEVATNLSALLSSFS